VAAEAQDKEEADEAADEMAQQELAGPSMLLDTWQLLASRSRLQRQSQRPC
jgi:hypothetical protein